jgi:hypothetical protein
MLKFLRIAATALCLTACVLLVALWVRSFETYDDIVGHVGQTRLVVVCSYDGYLGAGTSVWPSLPPPYTEYHPWRINSFRIGDESWFSGDSLIRWRYYEASAAVNDSVVLVPHWFVASLTAALAGAPWVRFSKRFSLHTLLIATTLVGLGIVVAAM